MKFEDGKIGQKVRVIPGQEAGIFPVGFIAEIKDLTNNHGTLFFRVAGPDGREANYWPERFEPVEMSDQELANEWFRLEKEMKELSAEKGKAFNTLIQEEASYALCLRQYRVPNSTKTIPPVPSEPITVELLPPSA
jgi:hypothetical protein